MDTLPQPRTGDELRNVFLFDVDGTLVSTGGAGREAMGKAFQAVHGISDAMLGVGLAGRVDPQIYGEVLQRWGAEPDIEIFQASYFDHLEKGLQRANGFGCVLPGVLGLLERLSSRGDCLVGLLTGNWRKGAELKLRHFRLWHYFPFGVFGGDAPDRRSMAEAARDRLGRLILGRSARSPRVYVVGDTPKDVDCARHAGLRSVAVATGEHGVDELAGHEPDLLLRTLADWPGLEDRD